MSWPLAPARIPIPEIFHSLKDGPFRRCVECDVDLLADGRRYSIQRVFHDCEPIIEFAVCDSCGRRLRDGVSQESRKRLDRYVREQLDFHERIDALRDCLEAKTVEPWLSRCLFTGQKTQECRERILFAQCEAQQLLLDASPYMISGLANEQMSELLSPQTRGWMDDFCGRHFGMPPEFCDSPDPLPVLV